MPFEFTTDYIQDSLAVFRYYKKLTERAIAQVPDEHLCTVLDPEMNSIAIIVKHMAGNMRSRWMNFLTSDGEKPNRNRDSEFLDAPATRDAILVMWNEGWDCLFHALEPLAEQDLARSVAIRGEAHSVMQAINRQMAHYSYHCGQIVLLAKHFGSVNWQALTVARGKSEEFNRRVLSREASQR
jgi:uncharacterized damage-inducible protein DinB